MNGTTPVSSFSIGNNTLSVAVLLEYGSITKGWGEGSFFLIRKNNPAKFICSAFMQAGDLSGNCNNQINLSYKDIDPKGYQDLLNLIDDIQTMANTISGMTEEEIALYQNATDLIDAINRILNGDLSNMDPQDFCGVLSVESCNALKNAKRAWDNAHRDVEGYEDSVNEYENTVDALESEIADDFNETRDMLYDINNTTTEELVNDDIDPEDNTLTDYGIMEINMDSIDLPNVDESVEFDWNNNIYDEQATQVIAALNAELYRDRKVFIFIVNAWSANQIEIDEIIRARTGIINGEIEAFLQAYARVNDYLFNDEDGVLDRDFYFKDCIGSMHPSLKREVNRLSEHFPEEAAILKEKLNNVTEMDFGNGNVQGRVIEFINQLKRLADLVDFFVNSAMDEIERKEELKQVKSMVSKTPDMLDAMTSTIILPSNQTFFNVMLYNTSVKKSYRIK